MFLIHLLLHVAAERSHILHGNLFAYIKSNLTTSPWLLDIKHTSLC